MKKLWITLVFAACTNPALSRLAPNGPSVMISGASVDNVRDSVSSNLTGRGYSLMAANAGRIVAEKPVRSDWSASCYSHREYYFRSVSGGVSVVASDNLIDRSATQPGANKDQRDVVQMEMRKALNDELLALRGKFSR
jgi:hypothetical protein